MIDVPEFAECAACAAKEEQRTARSKQQTFRALISALVVVIAGWMMKTTPAVAVEIAVMVCVLLGGGNLAYEVLNREPKKLHRAPTKQ